MTTDCRPDSRFRHVIFEGAPAPAARVSPRAVHPGQPLLPRPQFHRHLPSPQHERVAVEFARWVLDRVGLNPAIYRANPLARRVPACLRALGVRTELEARQALAAQPALLHRAAGALLIGVTAFFRDPEIFNPLRHTLLPHRLAQRPSLRVWSAACSDGSELYSLAILLDQLDALPSAELLGTDCRPAAIAQAAEGAFLRDSLDNLPQPLRQRYFTLSGHVARITPALRNRATWICEDVLHAPDRGQWDLILCRNLAIYFEPHATADLWQRLTRALLPGGLLIVGKAERPSPNLPLRRLAPGIYAREGALE